MTPTKAINFTESNLRKSLDGLKTQTRRQTTLPGENFAVGWFNPTIIRKGIEEPGEQIFGVYDLDGEWGKKTRYQPGDILAARTTWAVSEAFDHVKPSDLPVALTRVGLWFASDGPKPEWAGKSRPAMFLHESLWHLCPKMEILRVRVERLQAISEEDAIAEGCPGENCYRHPAFVGLVTDDGMLPVEQYAELWDEINGKGSWESNPFVECYDYRVIGGCDE